MKKKLFFWMMLTLVISTQSSCQKDEIEDFENLEHSLSNSDYEKFKTIFDGLPEIGFSSNNYEIANWDGTNKEIIPVSEKPWAIYKFSPLLFTEDVQAEISQWSFPRFQPLYFIDDSLQETKLQEGVLNIYLKNKLILNESIYENALFTYSTGGYFLGTSSLGLESAQIGDYEMLVTTRGYDFWARDSKIYLDGEIIFNYLPKESSLPLSGTYVKVWEKKFLIALTSHASHGEPDAFLILDPKTKELVIKEKN